LGSFSHSKTSKNKEETQMRGKFLTVLVVLGIVAAACAAPTPEVVEKEVVVEKPVVETVVVEKEVVVEKPVVETVVVEKEFRLASVKMGVLIPLTGPLAEFGDAFRKVGFLTAVQLGEAGMPTELINVDTETSAVPAVEAARTLVDVERVQILIGAAASGVSRPIAESVAIPSEIPQISYASTSPVFTVLPADEGKDFFFRTCPSDALQGVVLGTLASELYKTAAVMWVNNAYGEGLMEQFTKSFELRGGKVIASVPHDEAPATSYVAELRQATEGNPDVLVCISYPGHSTVYLKEAIEGGFIDEFLFCDGTKSVETPKEIGPEYLDGMQGTAPAASEAASTDLFEENYARAYGEAPPLPFITNIYDAIAVARLAAAKCEVDGLEATPICIRDNLRVVANPPGETITVGTAAFQKAIGLLREGKDINYEGVNGLDFDQYGDMVGPIEIWQYVTTEPYIERVDLVTEIPPE
jgi:branched-chain amino acid transport system substrate-binding protein